MVSRLIPLPKKLFSLTPNAAVVPDVPTPAPNEISPVGFSSTLISIIFKLLVEPALTVGSTILKIFFDLIRRIVISKALQLQNNLIRALPKWP